MHHDPLLGSQAQPVTRLDDLLPLGYGDKLIPVSDQRFARIKAQPGDVLVFRTAAQPEPGDVCTVQDADMAVVDLRRITQPGDRDSGHYVLVAHLRRLA